MADSGTLRPRDSSELTLLKPAPPLVLTMKPRLGHAMARSNLLNISTLLEWHSGPMRPRPAETVNGNFVSKAAQPSTKNSENRTDPHKGYSVGDTALVSVVFLVGNLREKRVWTL